MKILIATGIYPPEIGGPATYAKRLAEEFTNLGHQVQIATYGKEKGLPTGIRHLIYLMKSFSKISWSDKILVLDTFSVGIPIAASSVLLRRPFVIRIGGDFVWESYVERTHNPLPIPNLYTQFFLSLFNVKERIIFHLTKFVLSESSLIVFTTEWLKNIWIPVYKINSSKTSIIENTLEKGEFHQPSEKLFLWAGRKKFLKNISNLEQAFELVSQSTPEIKLECIQVSKDDLEQKLDECYAVILPSLSEVSPNFIHDSVSHGKPFIVTKYSGLNKQIESLGLVIDPISITDIKDKVIELSQQGVYDNKRKEIEAFLSYRPWFIVASDFIKALENAE